MNNTVCYPYSFSKAAQIEAVFLAEIAAAKFLAGKNQNICRYLS
jgi:hypothetical protein